MISILIPVYNYPVQELVLQLTQELQTKKIEGEILLLDDGSTQFSDQYSEFDHMEQVSVLKSKENSGRSKARNQLAEKARFDQFLFLDCDSLPVKKDFIQTYCSRIRLKKVLVGGTEYKNEYPEHARLHWLYGKKRESVDRSGFKSNNFLISREDFSAIRFDESLVQYGHEDTLLGISLRNQGIEIDHIDNPVYHCGLVRNEVFVKKTLLAVENAWTLYRDGKIKAADIRLIRLYIKWTQSILGRLFLAFVKNNYGLWLKYCLAKKPRLFALDFVKICKLDELRRNDPLTD